MNRKCRGFYAERPLGLSLVLPATTVGGLAWPHGPEQLSPWRWVCRGRSDEATGHSVLCPRHPASATSMGSSQIEIDGLLSYAVHALHEHKHPMGSCQWLPPRPRPFEHEFEGPLRRQLDRRWSLPWRSCLRPITSRPRPLRLPASRSALERMLVAQPS